MRVVRHLLIGALLIGLVIAAAAYVGQTQVAQLGTQPLLLDEPKELLVKPGSSFRSLIEQLDTQGIIDQPFLLRLYARQHKLA
ncbi:MAG: hypothetical protein V7752_15695, partial [Halopseudomonas sp.]